MTGKKSWGANARWCAMPFFNGQSSISRQICHVSSVHMHESTLNDTINYAQKGCAANLVPSAHVPFGQHQDTELWNNQFPKTKILGLSVSRRMLGFIYMARDKVDVDTFHKGIQYALEKLGKSKFGFERTAVPNFKSKRNEGSGNELADYFRTPYVSWC